MVEFNLQEEVLALQDEASYHIPGEIEVRDAAPDDIRTIFESKTRPYLRGRIAEPHLQVLSRLLQNRSTRSKPRAFLVFIVVF